MARRGEVYRTSARPSLGVLSAPKSQARSKNTCSALRRRTQVAMMQPNTATRVDVALTLKGEPPGGRLESAAGFNALFTHRVRGAAPTEVDRELLGWLKSAYDADGSTGVTTRPAGSWDPTPAPTLSTVCAEPRASEMTARSGDRGAGRSSKPGRSLHSRRRQRCRPPACRS
jgi:hypothetical protein